MRLLQGRGLVARTRSASIAPVTVGRFRKIIWATPVLGGAVAALATGAIGLPAPGAPKCRVFPLNNPWNQRVDHAPVSPRSNAYIAHLGADDPLAADFTIPYTTVPPSQRKVHVNFEYRRVSDHGPYPIPADVQVEDASDRHVIVLQRGSCKLYELYDAHPMDGGNRWSAVAGAIWNLHSNHLRPRGWTSADAAGLPILPGLARYDEVKGGKVNHALRVTAYDVRSTYVYPARHSDGESSSRAAPPMGTRFRLRPGFDISHFPRQARIILLALKRYGMFLADTGEPYLISGAPAGGWDDQDLEALRRVKGRDLQVVDTSRLPKPGR
jgi:hypothetical protein